MRKFKNYFLPLKYSKSGLTWHKTERSIRQEREEKRILRLEQRQKEAELNAEANKNYLNKNNKGRAFTISIAVPGSIIGKVQSRELKTYVAGQVSNLFSLNF